MVKYTADYCKQNEIFIHTPTLLIYKKITKYFKISSKLRDYNWKYYNKNTCVGFIKRYNEQIYDPCFHYLNAQSFKEISYLQFFKDNNINFNKKYELW